MDDQSCTLPSDNFPMLVKEGRFYSKDEIRQLCSYAKNRGIVLVPEIESPGHAKVLVETYPELFANHFDEGAKVDRVVNSDFILRGDSVICVGNEKTFISLTKFIDEVVELFPDSEYIHLGGDEVSTNAWKQCHLCREYMERNRIKDEEELFADFLGRITDYVLSKGRRPIIWEGFAKKYSEKISKEVIVMAWESCYQYPDDLVEGGFEVINCSWKPLYVVRDLLYSNSKGEIAWNVAEILNWNVYEWQHWWEGSAAKLNPFHLSPTEKILGAQLCSWEMTYECEIAEIIVRLAALSEKTWSVKRYCNDAEFIEKLKKQVVKAFRLIVE